MKVENHDLLDAGQLTELTRPSAARWLLAAGREWIIIASAVAVALRWPVWWVWLAAALVIGTRQNALGVLTHEGTHGHAAKSIYWNDALSNWLTSYPMFISAEGFRTVHMRHHNHLEMADDPSRVGFDSYPEDWYFPTTRMRLLRTTVRDLSGLGQAKSSVALLKYVWNSVGRSRGGRVAGGFTKHLVRIALLHGAIVIAALLTHRLPVYLLLWIAPLFTVTIALYRMRGSAEHCGLLSNAMKYKLTTNEPLKTTRTIVAHPVMRWFVVPYNVSYHLEHHLYPTVPFFQLRRTHELLVEKPLFRDRAHITYGHRALIRELTAADIAPGALQHGHH